jgi:hypothetical protein
MKTLAHYLCKTDGSGRAVRVAERKTFGAIRRLSDLRPGTFVVTAYLADRPCNADHGTVYFFDENGGQVEVANP